MIPRPASRSIQTWKVLPGATSSKVCWVLGTGSLNAADSALFPADVPAEFPVELDVQVIGQPQASSADFARSLPGPQKQQPNSPTPDPTSGTAALFAAADQPADPALTIALVGVIALLGGLVLGALAMLVLGLGRRRA